MSKSSGPRATAHLNGNTGDRIKSACKAAQESMAREVLEGAGALAPVKTGKLRSSGHDGENRVTWSAPYARIQYERHREKSRWFERWKAQSGKALVDKVKKEVGNAL